MNALIEKEISGAESLQASSSRSPAIPALSSIRFLLALSILFGHFTQTFPIHSDFFDLNLAFDNNTAVAAFFCLSGFVTTYQYGLAGKPINKIDYFRKRVARIFPLYWACLLLAVMITPLQTIFPDFHQIIPVVVVNFFLLQAWTDNPLYLWGIVVPAYSLSMEVAYSVLFPFIINSFRKTYGLWLLLSLSLFGIISFTTPMVAQVDWWEHVFPLCCVYSFILGMTGAIFIPLLKQAHSHKSSWDFWTFSSLELILAVVFLRYGVSDKLAALFLFTILMLVLTIERGILSRILGWRPLAKLGELSYAIYLLHHIFLRALISMNFRADCLDVGYKLVAYTLFCVSTSYIIHKYLEQPWRQKLCGKLPQRPVWLVALTSALAFGVCILMTTAAGAGLNVLSKVPTTSDLLKEALSKPLPQYSNLDFAGAFQLEKLYLWPCPEGLRVVGYWKTGEKTEPATSLGVHIIDRRGMILAQADHRLLTSDCDAHGIVRDAFTIPTGKLEQSVSLGLLLYKDPHQPLNITNAPNFDCNGRRLIITLAENMSAPAIAIGESAVSAASPWNTQFSSAADFAHEIQSKPLAEFKNIIFDKAYQLEKIFLWHSPQGLRVVGYWKTGEHPQLAKQLGVHLLDIKGKIVGQADHSINANDCSKAGTLRDAFTISTKQMEHACNIGLLLYTDPRHPLTIDAGPKCDCDQRRLLIPLPAKLDTAGHKVEQAP